jgi:hypothetical protein
MLKYRHFCGVFRFVYNNLYKEQKFCVELHITASHHIYIYLTTTHVFSYLPSKPYPFDIDNTHPVAGADQLLVKILRYSYRMEEPASLMKTANEAMEAILVEKD